MAGVRRIRARRKAQPSSQLKARDLLASLRETDDSQTARSGGGHIHRWGWGAQRAKDFPMTTAF
eukprot:5383075-Lingulodinium_polyedra.AAC.1